MDNLEGVCPTYLAGSKGRQGIEDIVKSMVFTCKSCFEQRFFGLGAASWGIPRIMSQKVTSPGSGFESEDYVIRNCGRLGRNLTMQSKTGLRGSKFN